MATKTITVTEDAYKLLKGLKTEEESFSHLLVRLAKERAVGEKYFGLLKGDAHEARKIVKGLREKASKGAKKRQHELFRHLRHN